jgi:hypothetical protein
MPRIIACTIFFASFVVLSAFNAAFGQETTAPAPTPENKTGAIKFTAQADIGGKPQKLDRKRFYLIRGSRQQNTELLKQIAETTVLSRDCYFADLRQKGRKISDEYVCWLKNNECESSYCREVKTSEEALSVPEFAVAYRQGLREYRQPAVALKWLNTNLPDEIRNGYYLQYKNTLERLIALAKVSAQEATQAKKSASKKGEGFQTIMTDRLGNAYFLDVDVVPPEKKKTETYLISNLLPMVFGDTSYVWTCEIEVDPTKLQTPFLLKTEIGKKTNNKCEVVTKKQTEVCNLTECGKPSEKPAEKPAESN